MGCCRNGSSAKGVASAGHDHSRLFDCTSICFEAHTRDYRHKRLVSSPVPEFQEKAKDSRLVSIRAALQLHPRTTKNSSSTYLELEEALSFSRDRRRDRGIENGQVEKSNRQAA